MDKTTQQILLLDELKKEEKGLNISSIELIINVSRRTAQRLLNKMILAGDVAKEGRGKLTRYVSTHNILQKHSDTPTLSAEAQKIYESVNQPYKGKLHTGYQRSFLDQYEPNQTFYLSKNIRQHLLKIGSQPQNENSKIAGTFAKHILNRFMVDLSWNSSRLEGNTYSLLETEDLILTGNISNKHTALETQMILNHKNAIEYLVDSAEEIQFTPYYICGLHALLSNNLLGNPMACGSLRQIAVGIHKTSYQPIEIPQLIDELFQLILKKANNIQDPFEQAFFAMVHLPYLQAFEDVNKRVSRLSANIPMIRNNLCPIAFIELSEEFYITGTLGVYEQNRVELLRDVFVWIYERSCLRYSSVQHFIGQPDPFRLKYHEQICHLVKKIVTQNMSRRNAVDFIDSWTKQNIEQSDQSRFVEVINTELMSLHIGNVIRFRITQNDFETWLQGWAIKQDQGL